MGGRYSFIAWVNVSGEFGGPDGDRTHDLYIANVALSQLSYRPFDWKGQ